MPKEENTEHDPKPQLDPHQFDLDHVQDHIEPEVADFDLKTNITTIECNTAYYGVGQSLE